MKNNSLSFLAFIGLCVICCMLYAQISASRISSGDTDVRPKLIKPAPQDSEAVKIIRLINSRNEKIKNFVSDNIDVYVSAPFGATIKLGGDFKYEKDLKLNMNVRSIFGDEFFMGSCPEQFWFWSRHLDPPALYYADHSDFYKTRLKSVFDPLMVMDSIGLKTLDIDCKDVAVHDEGDKIVIVRKKLNSIGQPIGHLTVIDKKNKRIAGHMIVEESGQLIATSQIVEYVNDLPKVIFYNWHQEQQIMLVKFKDIKTNVEISSGYWNRPEVKEEIDMGKETVYFKWASE